MVPAAGSHKRLRTEGENNAQNGSSAHRREEDNLDEKKRKQQEPLEDVVRRVVRQEIVAACRATPNASADEHTKALKELILKEVCNAVVVAFGSQSGGMAPAALVKVETKFKLGFANKLRDNIYAVHKTDSKLTAEGDKPLVVNVTTLDGKTTSELDGMEVEAVLMHSSTVNGAEGELALAKPRKNNMPQLIQGNNTATVVNGRAEFKDHMRVQDNSSNYPGGKFVLEIRPVGKGEGVNGHPPGYVASARTEPFKVKSSRAKDNEKRHDNINMDDDVYRLMNISKNGEYYKRLHKEGITTVRQFHQRVMRSNQGKRDMRDILGPGMNDANYQHTWQHVLQAVKNEEEKNGSSMANLYVPPNHDDNASNIASPNPIAAPRGVSGRMMTDAIRAVATSAANTNPANLLNRVQSPYPGLHASDNAAGFRPHIPSSSPAPMSSSAPPAPGLVPAAPAPPPPPPTSSIAPSISVPFTPSLQALFGGTPSADPNAVSTNPTETLHRINSGAMQYLQSLGHLPSMSTLNVNPAEFIERLSSGVPGGNPDVGRLFSASMAAINASVSQGMPTSSTPGLGLLPLSSAPAQNQPADPTPQTRARTKVDR